MRRHALPVLTAAVLLAVAGCSGSDDDAAAPGGGATSSAPPASAGTGAQVDLRALKGNRWSVSQLQLKAGESVLVTNADPDVPHNFVVDGVGKSPTMQSNDTFTLRFDKTGTFDFVCTFHPGMEGKITVS